MIRGKITGFAQYQSTEGKVYGELHTCWIHISEGNMHYVDTFCEMFNHI